MTQRIETPSEHDIDWIARHLLHADQLVVAAFGDHLDGSPADLGRLQRLLDENIVAPQATYSLHALGMALGKVFVECHEGYDWWMVEDEYGRDPAIRCRETSLLVFPQTLISKRVEDGEEFDVRDLHDGLAERLKEIRREIGADV